MTNLSEQERQEVLRILNQLSNGDKSSYNALLFEDYNEIPGRACQNLYNEL